MRCWKSSGCGFIERRNMVGFDGAFRGRVASDSRFTRFTIVLYLASCIYFRLYEYVAEQYQAFTIPRVFNFEFRI